MEFTFIACALLISVGGLLGALSVLAFANKSKEKDPKKVTELDSIKTRLSAVEEEKKLSQESRLNLAGRVRDMGVEISNFQDHLAKVRDSVLDVNNKVSNKRPVVKLVVSSELLQQATKPTAKLKAKGH